MQPVQFTSKTIAGRGRGHDLGFPTLNLTIPDDLRLQHGIYACWVQLPERNEKLMGALHYGPVPVFDEMRPALEVHLLDYAEKKRPPTLTIEVVKKLRAVMLFDSPKELIEQITRDVAETRKIFSNL